MTKSKLANRYSPEVRARAVRMVFEHQGSYETQVAAIAAIAPKIGCIPQTLNGWVKQAEKDSGMRDGVTTEERDRIKTLERVMSDNKLGRHRHSSWGHRRGSLRGVGAGRCGPVRSRSLKPNGDPTMPGRSVTDQQVRLYMTDRLHHTQRVAAARAGLS